MVSNIQPKKLIKTNEFVREPIDDLYNKIKQSESKKIILTGSRGAGKSTVLYDLENKCIRTKNPTIYTCFDSVSLFNKSNSDYLTEDFKKQYYEMSMCFKILEYIKNYYKSVYKIYFEDIYNILKEKALLMDKYINTGIYNDKHFEKVIDHLEITSIILSELKNILELKSINIAFDRFDWVNGSDSSVQKILSNYFDLFDKVVITTDDNNININKLEEKGYLVIDVNYGKKESIIKEIIRRRISANGEISVIDEKNITNKIYNTLIRETNGNLSLILNIVREVYDLCEWNQNSKNIEEMFETYIEKEVEAEKQFRKIYKSPNLYL